MVLDKTFIFYFNAIKVLGLGNSNRGVGRAGICFFFCFIKDRSCRSEFEYFDHT